MGDDFANDSLLELYLFESTTLLDNLDLLLIEAEKKGALTQEQINEIFRIMHTIKGSSAMMAYNAVADVAHHMEDIFSVAREHGIREALYNDLFDMTLKASKFLESEVDKIQNGEDTEENPSRLIDELIGLCERIKEGLPQKPMPDLGRILGGLPGRMTEKKETRNPEPTPIEPIRPEPVTPEPNQQETTLPAPIPITRFREVSIEPEPALPEPESVPPTEEEIYNSMPETPEGGRMLGAVEKFTHFKPSLVPDLPQSSLPDYQQSAEPGSYDSMQTYYLHVFFNEGAKMENVRAFMLASKLSESGIVHRVLPDDLENNPDTSDIIIDNGFYISYSSNLVRGQIEALAKSTLSVESVAFVRKMPDEPDGQPSVAPVIQKMAPSAPQAPQVPSTPQAQLAPIEEESFATTAMQSREELQKTPHPQDAGQRHDHPGKAHVPQNIISVDINKLDSLMDLVGEIVINESMVTESPDIKDLPLENFRKAAHQLDKLTYELQDGVMSVRMVPLSTTFQRMLRIVRDMSKELGKTADLTIIGENTEVDKTIVDALSDPLMHLVRNAMDHAIESPEKRQLAGKSTNGHIVLSAQNSGSDIIISISDDGIGLDPVKILDISEEKGLLRKPRGDYSEKEIYNFLLLPGFSTKHEVTEFSGRGVGLDVVKTKIEKIGGSLSIESAKGLGTNIFLKIPLTLAIIDCMEIRLGNDTYAIPITNIQESFKTSSEQLISDPAGNEMIFLRGKPYPIVRLYEKFLTQSAVRDIKEGILILVDTGDRKGCLLVDELIGKYQVVVKAIPEYLQQFQVKSSGISGCTIIGTGAVCLILDVGELLL